MAPIFVPDSIILNALSMIPTLNPCSHQKNKTHLDLILFLIIFMNMDMDRIFDLFAGGNDDLPIYTNKELAEIRKIEEFKETPMFKLGMFKKIIFNHISYKDRIIQLFKNVRPKLDVFELDKAGDIVTFERGWDFISQCKLEKSEWRESLKLYNNKDFKNALKLTLKFYQGLEEYEKCAYLKKILDFFKKDLATQK